MLVYLRQPHEAEQRDRNDMSTSSSTRLSENELKHALTILTIMWAASAMSLAASIKRKYLQTFFSTETASQYTIRLFRESKADEARFRSAFGNNSSYTESIKAEIKQWLDEKYPIWQLERPPWFTDVKIALIPTDMLPKEVLRQLITKGGGARRRSTISEKLGGGERSRITASRR